MVVYIVAPCVGAWIETVVKESEGRANTSHPVWVRGLKPLMIYNYQMMNLSHPVWVRGLKLMMIYLMFAQIGRTLCGCVD